MSSKAPLEPQTRPEVGDTLIVIHDFQARSSDELSLSKGDRVELIERDDEFGDGWFLGRNQVNDNTGLFPEVYTRLAPKAAPVFSFVKSLAPVAEVNLAPVPAPDKTTPSQPLGASTLSSSAVSHPALNGHAITQALTSNKSDPALPSGIDVATPTPSSSGFLNGVNQDSQVLNDTLNVINEHITDLRSPPSTGALRTPATDSGSEYSAALEHRLSYIQGEETDEEEDQSHATTKVEDWTPEDVANHLLGTGVEKQHCEVFKDQEISGEVILAMDQSSLFIKAFDLGSVGRRLKTWHKIKALQDEVKSQRATQKVPSQPGHGVEAARKTRSRTNTVTTVTNRPSSVQSSRLSTLWAPNPSSPEPNSPITPLTNQDSPTTATNHFKRPSAASVRDLHHSRRHSSTDFRVAGALPDLSSASSAYNTSVINTVIDGKHRKHPSFDRNWTLGTAISRSPSRPLSSAGAQVPSGPPHPELTQDSAVDLDRGYFSGTEADGRKRNVLRKRESLTHAKRTSYADEQRIRGATTHSRHSRFGSVDSFRDGPASPALQKYYGIQPSPHRRTASTSIAEPHAMPNGASSPPPIVTNLDFEFAFGQGSPPSAWRHAVNNSDSLSLGSSKPSATARSGMRAISDKLASHRVDGSSPHLYLRDYPVRPSARTGSASTPSAGPSLDLELPIVGKGPDALVSTTTKAHHKKKGKKATSAYLRGLANISPREAILNADYYGWMKKKSSNLMTTWKPRLFVLKGRRLAYYYSQNDEHEKGLIDISFHRVLPADNERLTGLHATLTGAAGGQGKPAGNLTSSAGGTLGMIDKGDHSVFIFKLVPPRAGLSRAVNFTKPTVHYFAVSNLQQGRLWMAALMKATIDRDDMYPVTTTYQQKTISLAKAKQMRHRPPALMNLEDSNEEEQRVPAAIKPNGLKSLGESDSGVSGMEKMVAPAAEVSSPLSCGLGSQDGAAKPQSA